MKLFTIRMFTATKTGHEFIHKRVELSDECFAIMQAWASQSRADLIKVKYAKDERQEAVLWAPVYESYNKMIASLPAEFHKHPDNAAVIAHFFTLCIDNPELIAEPVTVSQMVSV
ncbi:hypothetical protein [Adonisia turfae]|uniref:Uncharacterized protein n=1 Tax=Adonisia turfae CCMR0081 TaxID=2292702 RepID=A0A6M0RGQ1_9CYAN|nr:hypothetical protein [Adonisia turfae]NEZ55426.1 hypothetical protein [Adonisia turfae CCMR0081]